MIAIHPFPIFFQCLVGHFCEVWIRAMRMSPIVMRYVISSLETMLIITP